jgi:hypothetical protein
MAYFNNQQPIVNYQQHQDIDTGYYIFYNRYAKPKSKSQADSLRVWKSFWTIVPNILIEQITLK